MFNPSKLWGSLHDLSPLSSQDVPQDVPQDVTQGGTQGGTQDDIQGNTLDIWIEEQIRKNPKVTTEELATLSGFTSKTIKRHINKLAHIRYVGRGYSGHWEIIENNAET